MSLFSSHPLATQTAYRAEFTHKHIDQREPTHHGSHAPHNQMVTIQNPLGHRDPDFHLNIETFRKKVKDRTYTTRKLLSQPLDPRVVEMACRRSRVSTYGDHYCHLDPRQAESSKCPTELPPDWVTPATTQRCSYRHPTTWLSGNDFVHVTPITPKHNLGPDMKEREILQVRTGESDYKAQIGHTGQWIISSKLHGDVDIRPTFHPADLLKAVQLRKALQRNK